MIPMTPELATNITVLVLSDSAETGALLGSLLAQEEGLQVRPAPMAFGEGLKAVARYEPHVVVVTDTLDSLEAAIEALDVAAPGIPTVAILPEGDHAAVQACSLAGARATLLKPFDQESLLDAIRQVHLKELRRKQYAVSALDSGAARRQRPRVVAVHGAKGGVGTTTIAANLAAALHHVTDRSVALIDGDVLGGDAGVLFDLASPQSLADLLPLLKELDADLVRNMTLQHGSGVSVLLAPDQLQRAEMIGGEEMQRTLVALRPYFDYQIVDTPSQITPVSLAALDEADTVVLVVTPDIASIRSAARFLQLTTQFGYPADKVRLLVNRANSGREITPNVIEEYLRRPVGGTLPSDADALTQCLNSGELLVTAHPRHKVAAGIEHLARDIASSFGWMPQPQNGRRPQVGTAAQSAGSVNGSPGEPARPGRLARILPSFGRGSLQVAAAVTAVAPLVERNVHAK